GAVVGQFVVRAERLALIARPGPAGHIHLLPGEVVPERVQRLPIGFTCGDGSAVRHDVRRAAAEIYLADGVADHLLLLGERDVVLMVRAAAENRRLSAARLDHARRQLQIALLARLPIELDERHLGLLMATGADALPRPKYVVEMVGEARGDV